MTVLSHPTKATGPIVDRHLKQRVEACLEAMQTGAVVRIADIHARTFADGIQSLQDLDGICAIFGASGVFGRGRIGHVS